MKRTTITHPDGSVTRVESRSGCGCGAAFTLLLGVFVITAPAYNGGRGTGHSPKARGPSRCSAAVSAAQRPGTPQSEDTPSPQVPFAAVRNQLRQAMFGTPKVWLVEGTRRQG
jgi:hypothetical protein